MMLTRTMKLALAVVTIALGVTVSLAVTLNGHSPSTRVKAARLSFADVKLSQIRWVAYQGYLLPESATAGPRDTAGGFASGFADTPLGALLAALNIAPRSSWQFGPAVFQPVIEDQVTGEYRPDLRTSDLYAWDAAGQQTPRYSTYAKWIGFAGQSYTPLAATVNAVEGATTGTTVIDVATQIRVQWSHGDWKLVAPPGGNWDNASVRVTSLSGYTLFPAEERS
jgi:hypothetical protein